MSIKPIKIAVVSDLHTGSGARAGDLCPTANELHDKDFLGRFESFITQESIKADYLLLPGDISHRAQPQEIDLAASVISKISNWLSIPHERIIFVPGNHDVDWSNLVDSDPTGFHKERRYSTTFSPRWLFDKLHKSAASGTLTSEPHYCFWNLPDCYIIGYNSSWHDNPNQSEHHGWIAEKHLSEVKAFLQKNKPPEDKLKIFLVHHHSLNYRNPIPDDPEFSAMVNAEGLLDELMSHSFDIVVNGHRHAPDFQTITKNSGHPIAILASGSFSARLPESWNNVVNNQFHIIEVDGRDAVSRMAFGRLRSWSYTSAFGWRPSTESTGINHLTPFGIQVLPFTLETKLGNIVATNFSTKTSLSWRKLTELIPEFSYISRKLAFSLLKKIATARNLSLYGNPDDGWALIKE